MKIRQLFINIKNNRFYETMSHSMNYLGANVAISALSLISLPVITRMLSPSEYGVLSVFNGYLYIFYPLLTLNTYVALSRYYFENKDDFNEFFGTLFVTVICLLSLLFILSLLFRDRLSTLLHLPTHTIAYIIPLILFFVFSSWFAQLFMARRQSAKVAVRNILNAYGSFILAVLLIAYLHSNKYLGQIYATLIVGIMFSAYYYFAMRSYFKLSFKLSALKYSLAYGLPLLPYSLSAAILDQFDRVMINKYTNYSDAGLYSVAYSIGMQLTMAISALHQAWEPDYFKHMDKRNYDAINADVAIMFNIITACSLFLILFGQDIGLLLTKSTYHIALSIVPIIVLGYFFYAIFIFFAWNIQYAKKNIYLSLIVSIASIINIWLNIVYIPQYGYKAAAYTTVVSYFCMAALGWWTSKTFLGLHSPPFRLIQTSLFFFLFFTAIYFVSTIFSINPDLFFILKITIILSFGVIIFKSTFHSS